MIQPLAYIHPQAKIAENGGHRTFCSNPQRCSNW